MSLVEKSWFIDVFIPTIQQRGAVVIKIRGQSSAASAAKAALDQMRTWAEGTQEGEWVSMGVLSDGSYGVTEDLMFSFPVTVVGGKVSIVKDLAIDDFSRERMQLSEAELKEEKAAIMHLI